MRTLKNDTLNTHQHLQGGCKISFRKASIILCTLFLFQQVVSAEALHHLTNNGTASQNNAANDPADTPTINNQEETADRPIWDVLISHVEGIKYPIGRYIVYFITGLFLFGLFLVFIEFLRIAGERSKFKKIVKNYNQSDTFEKIKKGEEIISTKAERENAKNILAEGVGKSIALNRVEEICGAAASSQTLREQLQDKMYWRSGLAKYIAGILVMLGLIGTLIGLSISIKEIQPMISELQDFSNISAVIDMMFNTLSGMETAFTTTIAGLSGTILLTLFIYFFNRYHTFFITRLEEFSVGTLIPLLQLPTDKDSISKWFERVEAQIKLLSNSYEKLDHASGRFLIGTLKMEEFSEDFKNGAKNIVDFKKDAGESVSQLGKSIDGLKSMVETGLNSVNQIASNIQKSQEKTASSAEQLAAVIHNATTFFQDAAQQLSINENNLETAIEKLEDIMASNREYFDEYNKTSLKTYSNNFMQISDSFNEEMKKTIARYKDELDGFARREDHFIGNVVEYLALSDQYLSEISEGGKKQNENLIEIIKSAKGMDHERTEHYQRMTQVLEKILLALNDSHPQPRPGPDDAAPKPARPKLPDQ